MKMPYRKFLRAVDRWTPQVFVGLLLVPSLLNAMPLSESTVRSAVQTWVRHVTADRKPDAMITRMEPFRADGEIVAYIAHIAQGGYCLCGANDLVLPVYLYCPSGNYDPANPETQFILREISLRTLTLSEGITQNDPEITQYQGELTERASYWNQLEAGIAPKSRANLDERTEPDSMDLDLTCQWGQNSPYNALCPLLTGTERTIVGCTATATAQIMYYWQWPNTGVGNDSVFYDYRWRTTWDQEPLSTDPGIPENWGGGNRLDWSSGSGGRLWMNGYWDWSVYIAATLLSDSTGYRDALDALWSRMNQSSLGCYANFGAATFDWSLMEDRHYPPPSGSGDAEVAELSYDVAVAVDSDFGIWSTSSDLWRVPTPIRNYFRYDPDVVYGPRNLNTMVEEIQWLRPLAFSGSDGSNGHGWVVFGYNKLTNPWQFHLNMGWNGGSDGWYSCDNIPGNLNLYHNHMTKIAPQGVVKFVGGSTVGDGSPDSPYLNIIYALAYAPDNATLIFKAGTTNTFPSDSLVIDRPFTLKGQDIIIRRQ